MLELPSDFIHEPPEGYSYEVQNHKRNVVAIWLRDHHKYSYTNDDVRTIWGFAKYNKDGTTTYFSPVNSKKIGKEVDLSDTRNYTAMQINYKGLEAFFT